MNTRLDNCWQTKKLQASVSAPKSLLESTLPMECSCQKDLLGTYIDVLSAPGKDLFQLLMLLLLCYNFTSCSVLYRAAPYHFHLNLEQRCWSPGHSIAVCLEFLALLRSPLLCAWYQLQERERERPPIHI